MNARLQAIKYITDALVRNRYVVFSPILYNKEIEDRSNNRPPEGWWLFNQNYLLVSDSFVLVELPGWEKDEDVIIKFDLARKLGKRITRFAWIDDAEKRRRYKNIHSKWDLRNLEFLQIILKK